MKEGLSVAEVSWSEGQLFTVMWTPHLPDQVPQCEL